jgi:hypothetical protein
MKAMWHVMVRDSKGVEVTDAKIALVKEADVAGKDFPFDTVATTHSHKGKGAYEPDAEIAPAAGKWFLAVNRNGSSAAVQPFTVKAVGSGFTVSSSPTIATVEAKSATAGSGATAVLNTSFVVKLFPSAEVVFVTGTDSHGAGVDFRIFAVDHAKALLQGGLVDKGTRVTIFCSDARARQHLAYNSAGNLVLVNAFSFGDASGIKPGQKHAAEKGKDLEPLHFYEYLSAIGVEDPHRVREVGIFSHSWPGGPILFDTFDHSTTDARDDADFDLRAKDFNATNLVLWPGLKDAMAANGSWHVWGCSATTMYKDWMREALKTKKDDQIFPVVSDIYDDGRKVQHIESRMTRKLLRVLMDNEFRSGSYLAAAATLGVPVFGAPPGVGADYSRVGGLQVMGVAGNTPPFAFFQQDFAPDFKPTTDPFNHGYVDYRAMQARAPPPAAPFDASLYIFTTDFDEKMTFLGFPDGKQAPPHHGTTATLTRTAKTDFPSPGRSGQLYVIDEADKTKSEAYYFQTDKKLFRVTRDAAQAFTVVSTTPL